MAAAFHRCFTTFLLSAAKNLDVCHWFPISDKANSSSRGLSDQMGVIEHSLDVANILSHEFHPDRMQIWTNRDL
jgi:hypothetical protein